MKANVSPPALNLIYFAAKAVQADPQRFAELNS